MGEYTHIIDDKGRLIIPAKFRSQLGDDFIITRGLDHCLYGYPLIEWQAVQQRLASLPSTNANARKLVRYFYSAACECQFDKQGRVNLPANLMQHAYLERDCVVIGVASHFEIWDAERWASYQDAAASDFDQLAAGFDGLSF